MSILPIENTSIHRITSGQVIVDLQSAVKELVENSLDAGATNIEVRFKEYGLKSVEVIDNGSGIAEEDHDSIALNHHTSKLSSFESLTTLTSFGFRGEALSSLCALCESVSVVTATENQKGVGCKLDMGRRGEVVEKGVVARQRGTTITLTGLFHSLPVRRKEFERNHKREFGKAMNLLTAYALVPCASNPNPTNPKPKGVRLTLTNTLSSGKKTHILAPGADAGSMAIANGLWGTKGLDGVCEFGVEFTVEPPKAKGSTTVSKEIQIQIHGLISKFTLGSGRANTDRQFFYINGRPCILPKIQKALNEIYRSFNVHQSPFIVANVVVPGDKVDVNVSPDKRSVFLHCEDELVGKLKEALEEKFGGERSTYSVGNSQSQHGKMKQTLLSTCSSLDSQSQRTKTANSSQEEVGPDEDQDISMGEPLLVHARRVEDNAGPVPKPSPLPSSPRAPPDGEEERDIPIPRIMTPTASPARRVRSRQPSSSTKVSSGTQPSVVNSSVICTAEAEEDDGISRTSNSSTLHQNSTSSVITSSSSTITNPTFRNSTRQVFGTSKAPRNSDSDSDADEPPRRRLKSGISSDGTVAKPRGGGKERDFEVMRSRVSFKEKMGFFARNRNGDEAGGISGSRGIDEEMDELVDDDEEDEVEMHRNLKRKRLRRWRDIDEVPQIGEKQTPIDVDGQDSISSGLSVLNDNLSQNVSEGSTRPEIIRSSTSENISMRFDLAKVSTLWSRVSSPIANANAPSSKSKPSVGADAGVSNTEDNRKAADTLSRVIDKGDFAGMEIAGQFNLGFIVVRHRKSVSVEEGVRDMDDLFIVDQHAADEKYNFEMLQQNTSIESQKLFRPQPLELTAADELLAIENMDVLRQNGFEVEVDNREGTHHLKLVAQPVSKDTTFDMKDLEELLHLMQDRPSGQMVRCSKARAMFAMRACRKSVMVGMPLAKSQMTSVIQHMGTMDQPWNCPHGRPTMRHITDITDFGRENERTKSVDWLSYGHEHL